MSYLTDSSYNNSTHFTQKANLSQYQQQNAANQTLLTLLQMQRSLNRN